MNTIMNNLYFFLWLLFMLGVVVSVIVVSMRENSRKKAAAKFIQPASMPDVADVAPLELNNDDPFRMN